MTYREPDEPEEYPVYLRGTRRPITRVEPGRLHTVGKDARCDVVVNDETAEWRHATMKVEGAGLRVCAASKGATFVQGIRVDERGLVARAGTKIQIAKTILSVEMGAEIERELEDWQTKQRELRNVHMARTMAGSLAEVPLADLLALLGTSKKSGELVVRRADDTRSTIHFARGRIVHVVIDERESKDDAGARAMLMEMLAWDEGVFDLDPPRRDDVKTADLAASDVVRDFNDATNPPRSDFERA